MPRVTTRDLARIGPTFGSLAAADLVVAAGWSTRAVARLFECSHGRILAAVKRHYPSFDHESNFYRDGRHRLASEWNSRN